MPQKPEDWTLYAQAVGPKLGLTVAPEWKPAVAMYLAMLANAADLYVDLPLDDARDEPAPVFLPGEPR